MTTSQGPESKEITRREFLQRAWNRVIDSGKNAVGTAILISLPKKDNQNPLDSRKTPSEGEVSLVTKKAIELQTDFGEKETKVLTIAALTRGGLDERIQASRALGQPVVSFLTVPTELIVPDPKNNNRTNIKVQTTEQHVDIGNRYVKYVDTQGDDAVFLLLTTPPRPGTSLPFVAAPNDESTLFPYLDTSSQTSRVKLLWFEFDATTRTGRIRNQGGEAEIFQLPALDPITKKPLPTKIEFDSKTYAYTIMTQRDGQWTKEWLPLFTGTKRN